MQKLNSKNQNHTSQKGITLIALIITIIVMLILVGVTINVALNGGLFTKAEEATRLTQIEAEKEELLSAVVAAIGNDGKVDLNYLDNNLPAEWKGTDGTYTSPKGNTYTVDENGKITYTEESSGGENPGGENPGGENTPVVFDWSKFGLVDIDTATKYTDYGNWLVKFSADGKMRVYDIYNGELYYELDATNPDIEELYFENRKASIVSGSIVSEPILYGYTVTMNVNNKDIEFKTEPLEGSIVGSTYTLIKEVVDNENIYSNEEVLKITGGTGGTYTGTWEVMERDASGNPTKFVSTLAVANVTLGEENNLEKNMSDYKNVVSILNTAAETATGITGARSVNVEDIETLAGIEDSDKGYTYNKPHTFNYTNHKDQVFVNESGDIVKLDAEGKEVTVNKTYYEYVLKEGQKEQLGTMASGEYWLASTSVNIYYLHSAGGATDVADFCVRYVRDGHIINSRLFNSRDYYVDPYYYLSQCGVRAVVSI